MAFLLPNPNRHETPLDDPDPGAKRFACIRTNLLRLTSFDRLYLPGYSDTCTSCTPISANLNKAQLPQLRQELLSYLSPDLYQKFQVPGSYYHIVGTKTAPYIIRTLYTIKDDQVLPQYQVKVTFTNDPVPAVADIQVYSPKEGKRFSKKLVLTSYKKMVSPSK
ncbi:MAG: hypothetical protein EOO15_16840 [Chitinophagaceae bacterium]|nr:MAG: hypothetical protein EOO15_16840 [Chitinophagaceae bacterium]